MAKSSSKRREVKEKTDGANNTDRISSLPDSMLRHILSFLPTKACVQTSLLSRRWRHVWEDIQVLDFHHEFEDEFESFKRFSTFVNGVLALRRSRDIRKMRLSCVYLHEDMFSINSITTWVRTAIGPKLEEFRVSLCSIDGPGFVMPSTLFTCMNLISLSLSKLQITQRTSCGSFIVNNLPNVFEASLDVYSAEEPPNTLLDLLNAISTTRILELCCATTKWLRRAPVLNFPEFCNLVSLDLVLPFFNSNFLMNMLSKCHRVRTLVIKIEKEPSSPLQRWVQATSIPRCFHSNLGFIRIEGFQGFTDEVAFAVFLLRHGLVLERLFIEWDDFLDMGTRSQIIRGLRAIQRGSYMCELIMI